MRVTRNGRSCNQSEDCWKCPFASRGAWLSMLGVYIVTSCLCLFVPFIFSVCKTTLTIWYFFVHELGFHTFFLTTLSCSVKNLSQQNKCILFPSILICQCSNWKQRLLLVCLLLVLYMTYTIYNTRYLQCIIHIKLKLKRLLYNMVTDMYCTVFSRYQCLFYHNQWPPNYHIRCGSLPSDTTHRSVCWKRAHITACICWNWEDVSS